jgi:hypothetical protein
MIANYVKVGPICLCALGMSNNSFAQTSSMPVKNIVLVHGAWADGSGWKGVYDILVYKHCASWLRASLDQARRRFHRSCGASVLQLSSSPPCFLFASVTIFPLTFPFDLPGHSFSWHFSQST